MDYLFLLQILLTKFILHDPRSLPFIFNHRVSFYNLFLHQKGTAEDQLSIFRRTNTQFYIMSSTKLYQNVYMKIFFMGLNLIKEYPPVPLKILMSCQNTSNIRTLCKMSLNNFAIILSCCLPSRKT